MKQRLIQTIAPNTRLRIVNELKRTQGLPAGELAERLGMSYMGVKDLCDGMVKAGLLDTWRQPQQRGRPFKLYRLTQRAHELFPSTSNRTTQLLLDAAQKLYGASAAEKLLLVLFQNLAAEYEKRLREGPVAERAKWFARLRDHEGCMSELETDGEGRMWIVEHHCPILDLIRAFPIVARLEAEMFQRVLGVPVQREVDETSGLYRILFRLGA